MMVIFALSSWYFVCFALWLHVHTFMEVEEMWAFNLFVLLVSSQISLSSFYLLLMTNHEVLPLVGLIYLWWWEILKAHTIRNKCLFGLKAFDCFKEKVKYLT
jgi:hypothetical protein